MWDICMPYFNIYIWYTIFGKAATDVVCLVAGLASLAKTDDKDVDAYDGPAVTLKVFFL